MASVCLYFQVHQPFRLKEYSFFHIGRDYAYDNDTVNLQILNRVADKCYIPANNLLLNLIAKHKGAFKIAFSLSGVLLEQLQKARPDVINSFKALVDTGCVEILAETYYHSLAFHYSSEEFDRQVKLHADIVKATLGVKPTVFRNTELVYNNYLGTHIKNLGYKAILSEGTERVLGDRSANHVYKATSGLPLLLRNYKLTDDVAFRFQDKNWSEYPLTATKYSNWLQTEFSKGAETINLFMDFETFGEHQWADSGIFGFIEALPTELLAQNIQFLTPSETVKAYKAKDEVIVNDSISWADLERDLSAWRNNSMQYESLEKLYAFEQQVIAKNNPDLYHTWAKLQTSDHFYYMSTKHAGDGAVHSYFSPYKSPYDAYLYYMNILSDFEIRLNR